MKWLGRCAALFTTILCSFFGLILFFFVTEGLGGFNAFAFAFMTVFYVPGAIVACALVTLPGLLVLDRMGRKSRIPGLMLGLASGAATGMAAWALSVFGLEHEWKSSLSQLPWMLVPGLGMGVLGTWIYASWHQMFEDWAVGLREQVQQESELRKLSPEERDALRSRLDRR